MKVKRLTEAKGPREVNFKQGGGQKIFSFAPLLSHFQNNGAAVDGNTLLLLQIQLAILCF